TSSKGESTARDVKSESVPRPGVTDTISKTPVDTAETDEVNIAKSHPVPNESKSVETLSGTPALTPSENATLPQSIKATAPKSPAPTSKLKSGSLVEAADVHTLSSAETQDAQDTLMSPST